MAALRLAAGLQSQGIPCYWHTKQHIAPSLTDRLKNKVFSSRLTCSQRKSETARLLQSALWKESKIIHLHNLHGDFFDIAALPRSSSNKKFFFTLHDMWIFTGHCAYSLDCQKYETGCGECPYLDTYPAIASDHTAREIAFKKEVFSQLDCTFIAPSHWIHSAFQKSTFSSFPIHTIPYGIDAEEFPCLKTSDAQEKLGLATDRLTILLSSADLSEGRKQQSLAVEAINHFYEKTDLPLQVVSMGKGDLRSLLHPDILYQSSGYITSPTKKAMVYSAANLFLFLSQADNLPLSIQESLLCGTPVLANRVGGVPEMIMENETGWLMDKLDRETIVEKLEEIAEPCMKTDYAHACRAFARETYDLSSITSRHITLYKEAFNQ